MDEEYVEPGPETDVVLPVELQFELPTDETHPVLLRGERATALFFNTEDVVRAGRGTYRATAVIEFQACRVTTFGYPPAQDLPGHPLYERGVSFYGMFEVLRSSWRDVLEAQHRACAPAAPPWSDRHFVITFHGSTFECLADGFKAGVWARPREEVVLDYLVGRNLPNKSA